MIELNPYNPPQTFDVVEPRDAIAIRRIRPSTTGLIFMLLVQSFGYAVAGIVALVMLALGETVDATLFGICFSVVHFFAMIFMIQSMRHVRRLHGLRNGRIAAGLACVPFISPAIWIGIPLGIWLFVVLISKDVVAAFGEINAKDGEPSVVTEAAS